MMKSILTLALLLATTTLNASVNEPVQLRAPAAATAITVVVEALHPLENAFDVVVKGGTTYHLENAARMSLTKMGAINNSLETGANVTLKVDGKEIVDVLLQ